MQAILRGADMRDLTDEELALAPEWATHYCIENTSARIDVCFFNIDKAVDLYHGQLGDPYYNEVGIEDGDRLIPKAKSFDITQHEWSDKTMGGYEVARCANGSIVLSGASRSKVLSKDDAIAIAKHFKLKPSDLK